MKSLTLWNDPIIAELHVLRAKLVINAKKAAQSLRKLRTKTASKTKV